MTKLFFVLALAGCLDPEPKAADFAALDSDDSDCAGGLDGCYKTCQAEPPSPTERCFKHCDLVFYGCIGLDQ